MYLQHHFNQWRKKNGFSPSFPPQSKALKIYSEEEAALTSCAYGFEYGGERFVIWELYFI